MHSNVPGTRKHTALACVKLCWFSCPRRCTPPPLVGNPAEFDEVQPRELDDAKGGDHIGCYAGGRCRRSLGLDGDLRVSFLIGCHEEKEKFSKERRRFFLIQQYFRLCKCPLEEGNQRILRRFVFSVSFRIMSLLCMILVVE